MFIKLHFSRKDFLTIKLFDNPATHKWFSFYSLRHNNKSFPINLNDNYNNVYLYKKHKIKYKNQIIEEWTKIHRSLNNLNDLGYISDIELPAMFDYEQSRLNLLHRFFTTNAIWDHKFHDLRIHKPNPIDCNFYTTMENRQHFKNCIEQINASVHFLESFTDPENRKILDTLPLNFVYVMTQNHIANLHTWCQFSLDEQKENYKYLQYLECGQPLVLLDNSITGKSYLQNFLEDDDPTSEDCTGREGSHGSFIIDTNDNRQKIYASDKFQAWADYYNLKNIPYEFAIGTVIDCDYSEMHKFKNWSQARLEYCSTS
jgi:hypothetical protein